MTQRDGSDRRWRLIVPEADLEFYRSAPSFGELLDDLNNLTFIEAEAFDPEEVCLYRRAPDGGPSRACHPRLVALHQERIAGCCEPDWLDMPQLPRS
jgi:hypothetical protein